MTGEHLDTRRFVVLLSLPVAVRFVYTNIDSTNYTLITLPFETYEPSHHGYAHTAAERNAMF